MQDVLFSYSSVKVDLDRQHIEALSENLESLTIWHRAALEIWATGFWKSHNLQDEQAVERWMYVLSDEGAS